MARPVPSPAALSYTSSTRGPRIYPQTPGAPRKDARHLPVSCHLPVSYFDREAPRELRQRWPGKPSDLAGPTSGGTLWTIVEG
jgi:hypothetical protein